MDWKEALKAARDEHAELVQQRDLIEATRADLDVNAELIDRRAIQLEQTIASLSELTGENILPRRNAQFVSAGDLNNMKLANACRTVLGSSNKFWTPINVRDELVRLGYDLTPYTNHLASIHAVLKRLFDSGEAVRIAGPDGKAMYRWKEPAPPRTGDPNIDGPAWYAQTKRANALRKAEEEALKGGVKAPPKRYQVTPKEDK